MKLTPEELDKLRRCLGHYDRNPYARNFYAADEFDLPVLESLRDKGLVYQSDIREHDVTTFYANEAGCREIGLSERQIVKLMFAGQLERAA